MHRDGHLLRRIAALPLWPLIAVHVLLSEVLWPLLRPAVQELARLHLVLRLRRWLEGLPAYPALLLLAVPFAILEPLKALALFWVASGHVLAGTSTLLALHGASLLSTERLFAVLKPKLVTIPWFAALWGRVERIRGGLIRRLRSTRAWIRLHGLLAPVSARLRDLSVRTGTMVRRLLSPTR